MNKPRLRKFDIPLFTTMMALLIIGLAALYSATYEQSAGDVKKQGVFAAAGLVLFAFIIHTRYRILRDHAYVIYAAGIAALILLLVIGKPIQHVTRWIRVGPFTLQVSEFMKLAYIMAIARYFLYRRDPIKFHHLFVPLALTLLPMLLILKQPDLGTAMVFVPILFAQFFAAGVRYRHMAMLIAGGLLSITAAWISGDKIIKPYQKERITAFFDHSQSRRSRLDEKYQLLQSQIAIGSGGWHGKGFLKGEHLYYVPFHHTDFIFAVIAEEWGFLGVFVLLGLYWLLIALGIGNAMHTREPFGRVMIVGIMTLMAFQVIVNTGMTVGLMPITGLTLPFISYGGSSLLSSFLGLALVMNVRMQFQSVIGTGDYRTN